MKKILLVVAAALCLTASVQAQKIGHITQDEIMRSMPEYTAAEKQIQEYEEALMKTLQEMKNELDVKIAKYEKDKPTMTQTMKEVTEKELGSTSQRFQERYQQADADMQKKQQELLKPIVEKLRKAIVAVGTKNGYDYILESSTVHFSKEANDLSKQVKTELGMK